MLSNTIKRLDYNWYSVFITDEASSNILHKLYSRSNSRDTPLQWRHDECDGASNLDCLLNRLFRRRSKKTPKLRVTGFCGGFHRWPVDSSHKRPVTQKMFPFDDVIMQWTNLQPHKSSYLSVFIAGLLSWKMIPNYVMPGQDIGDGVAGLTAALWGFDWPMLQRRLPKEHRDMLP